MQPARFSSSTFRNSVGWLSAWSEIEPLVSSSPSFLSAGSWPATLPPPICGFSYCSTVSPFTRWTIAPPPWTSTSTRTHWSPSKVFDVEPMQWRVSSWPFITTFVPGVHRFAVDRALPSPRPPSSCASIEIGKSWSFFIVSTGWPWTITPLLRNAQSGPSFTCSPTKRYSTAIT